MSPQKPIYDFFAKSNNLSTALEMSKYLEQFELDMHKRFWSGYNTYMGQKLISNDLASYWKFSSYNTRRIRKDWEKSKIISLSNKDSSSELEFIFGQAGKDGGFPLYWGICWDNPPKNFSSSTLITLNSLLISKNISIPEPPKWIYWGYYKYRVYDPDFLVRCYLDFDGLIQEIIDDVWNMFSEISPLLIEINQEVKGNHS